MSKNYFDEYTLITGETNSREYISPEDEANKIEKCTILKNIDVTYGNKIEGYFQNGQQVI